MRIQPLELSMMIILAKKIAEKFTKSSYLYIAKLKLYKAHTPCVPCICIIMQLKHNLLLTTFTYTCSYVHGLRTLHAVMANGCGCDGQQNYTIFYACKSCRLILSALMPIFAKFDKLVVIKT